MRIFIFIVITYLTLSASCVKWYGDYELAHQEALKQNKQLLIFLMKKDSSVAKKVIKDSFMNQNYIDIINQKFISVLVTKGQKNSYPIELLYTLDYPAVFFLDKHELFLSEAIKGDITPQVLEKYFKSYF